MNRGRLIGNLERLVLTLVVVAGSYAALGFLVAAKGLIRSEGTPGAGICGILPGGLLMQRLGCPVCRPGHKVHASSIMAELLSLQMGS